ncbi:MAG: AMP-binding protein [bacterium]
MTFYLSVPSTFLSLRPQYVLRFCQTLSGGKQFPDLRLIVLGGEPVTRKNIELYKRFFPDQCKLGVRLASTEIFRIRTYVIDKETPISADRIPVGYPVSDKEVVLTTDNGQPVSLGEIGEIVVKSPYLSPVYWKNPSLTRTSFLCDPDIEENRIFCTGNLGRMQADGCLEFLDHKDSQTKIRGCRVEPGETEQAILDLENIQEAAVVSLEDSQGEKYLAAYLSAESKKASRF